MDPHQIATAPLSRHGAAFLTSLCLAVAVTACGSGGGSTAAAPTPTPPAPPAAASYYVAATSVPEQGQGRLHVVDPAAPGTPAMPAVDIVGMAPRSAVIPVQTLDAAAGTITTTGASSAAYVSNRRLYQVALKKPGTPTPVQVSTLSDACYISGYYLWDHTGDDGWAAAITAGADGDCATDADNRQAFVRTGATATAASAAPTLWPVGQRLQGTEPIYAADGKLQWLLAVDASNSEAPKLVAYGPTLANRIDVAGGAGVRQANIFAFGGNLADGWHLLIDTSVVRRLTGNATQLNLGPVLPGVGGVATDSGTSTVYLQQGQGQDFSTLVGDGPVKALATVPLPAGTDGVTVFSGSISVMGQTPTKLVVQQFRTTVTIDPATQARVQTIQSQVSAIDKATGTVRTLLAPTAYRLVVAVVGETIYFYSGTYDGVTELRSIGSDGQAETLLKAGVFGAGFVTTPTRRIQGGTPTQPVLGLIYCEPVASSRDCRNGTVKQRDLATGAELTLGTLSGSASALTWRLLAISLSGVAGSGWLTEFAGDPAVPTYQRTDLWNFTPGKANSLVRVSNNIP